MKIKPLKNILFLLTVITALSMVESIQAQDQSLGTGDNPLNQIPGQRGLVVEATNTPTPTPPGTTAPLVLSTPLADGTIIHIIAAGQTLWSIVDAYGIPFETLLELNDLEPDAVLNLGTELIISPPHTPTSTPIGEPSNTPPPRFTHTPSLGTPQATEASFSPATPVPTETIQAEPRFRSSVKSPLVVITAVLISGASLGAALFFSLRERG